MNEEPQNSFEKGPEDDPTPEEVQLVFEQLIEGKEYKTERKLEDEQGLYLWEVTVTTEDGHTEYAYMRKGRHPEGCITTSSIQVTLYDKDRHPITGTTAAEYKDGEWELIP